MYSIYDTKADKTYFLVTFSIIYEQTLLKRNVVLLHNFATGEKVILSPVFTSYATSKGIFIAWIVSCDWNCFLQITIQLSICKLLDEREAISVLKSLLSHCTRGIHYIYNNWYIVNITTYIRVTMTIYTRIIIINVRSTHNIWLCSFWS